MRVGYGSNGTNAAKRTRTAMSGTSLKIRSSTRKIVPALTRTTSGSYPPPFSLSSLPGNTDTFHSDYNFIRSGAKCVPAGPEPIPAGVCPANDPDQTFMGSSGWRRIPGNTCDREKGLKKDEKVLKSCKEGASESDSLNPREGNEG